jgi:exonuclease VII large subunit
MQDLMENQLGGAVSTLVGTVTAKAVKAALSGDESQVAALEARADSLDKSIDQQVDARADKLGERAEALCPRMQRLDELQSRALLAMRREHRGRAERVLRLYAELAAASPAARVAALGQRAAHAAARLAPSLRSGIALAGARLHAALRALHATSPLATLGRGYAIVTRKPDGAVLYDAAAAPPGTEIEARLARGTLAARVLPGKS